MDNKHRQLSGKARKQVRVNGRFVKRGSAAHIKSVARKGIPWAAAATAMAGAAAALARFFN